MWNITNLKMDEVRIQLFAPELFDLEAQKRVTQPLFTTNYIKKISHKILWWLGKK